MSLGMAIGSGGGGGISRAQTINVTVPLNTGLLTTVSAFGLLAPLTYAKTSGNANLTINPSTGGISATAALTAGATQSLVGTATGADGVVVPFTANLTGQITVPAAPTLSLSAGNGQVTVSWTDGSNGGSAITAHNLYRGTSSGGETYIGQILSGSPYTDTGLTNGTTYYYKLSAVNAVGESTLSTEQSSTPAAFPSGANGLYYVADYTTTPRKTIPNRMASGAIAADKSLLGAPRRMYTLLGPWNVNSIGSGNSVADNAAVSPDGVAGDASVITLGGTTGAWQLRVRDTNIILPAGTYTVCMSYRLASGTSNGFTIGSFGVSMSPVKTPTSTWQRAVHTFTSTGGGDWILALGNGAATTGTIEFCDFELFAGSSDQNTTWNTALPVGLQREDLRLGQHNYDPALAVSGGYITHGAVNALQLAAAHPTSAFSWVFLAKRGASPGTAGYDALLAAAPGSNWNKLTVGFSGGDGSGAVDWYGGNPQLAWNTAGPSKQVYSDLNFRVGDGPYLVALTYDGTTLRSYMNGIETQAIAMSQDSSAIKDFWLGAVNGNFFSGLDIAAFARWSRALSAAEVNSAGAAMQTTSGITVNSDALLVGFGTSITFGLGGKSYLYDFAANASKAVHGVNIGQSSAQIAAVNANVTAFLARLNANTTKPNNKIIATLEVGANDLISFATSGSANTAQCDSWLSTLAGMCDALRAAGCIVGVHTVLSRSDGTAQNTTNINLNRGYVNPIIRGWIGTGTGKHCDFVVDIAADATVGTDTATSNTTNFPDHVHPSASMYTTYWEPLFRAQVNPLL